MKAHWERWEKEGTFWRAIFAQVDRSIKRFASDLESKKLTVQVLEYRWDLPDRVLVFPSPRGAGLWNNIHLLVTGEPLKYHLRITSAAWQDVQGPGGTPQTRRWCHSASDQEKAWAMYLGDPLAWSEGQWEEQVYKRLVEVHSIVGQWVYEKDGWKGFGSVPEKEVSIP